MWKIKISQLPVVIKPDGETLYYKGPQTMICSNLAGRSCFSPILLLEIKGRIQAGWIVNSPQFPLLLQTPIMSSSGAPAPQGEISGLQEEEGRQHSSIHLTEKNHLGANLRAHFLFVCLFAPVHWSLFNQNLNYRGNNQGPFYSHRNPGPRLAGELCGGGGGVE